MEFVHTAVYSNFALEERPINSERLCIALPYSAGLKSAKLRTLYLCPLDDDELADLCLDEEDDVEENAGQDGGDHGPDRQLHVVPCRRDQPVPRLTVRHLWRIHRKKRFASFPSPAGMSCHYQTLPERE